MTLSLPTKGSTVDGSQRSVDETLPLDDSEVIKDYSIVLLYFPNFQTESWQLYLVTRLHLNSELQDN